MIQRMMTSALFAGLAAGLFAALLHFAFVQKQILLGEQYESGALVHFSGSAGVAVAGHDHADPAQHADGKTHAHGEHSGGERSDLGRDALTAIFTSIVYVAYGLILIAGFALAEHFGKRVTAREGLLWGIAGFASFQLMPAMGLAPELPGTIGADLVFRQVWWWGTAGATATGLALIGYGKGLAPIGLALALLAAPHVIGAPEVDQYRGVAPPELAAAFAARVLGVGLAVWALLGWLAGFFWSAKPT